MTNAPPQPIGLAQYPLSALYLTTINLYANQEDYVVRNGHSAPGFSSTMPVKLWEDPTAASVSVMIYEVVQLDINGNPEVMPLTMSGAEAMRVNIPPPPEVLASIPVQPNPPGVRPIPIRALLPGEQLVRGPAGSILVINTSVAPG